MTATLRIGNKEFTVGGSERKYDSAPVKAPRYDKDEIKHLAAGRWVEILSSVGEISIELLDGREHPCNKCGGNTRFRLIDEQAGAVRCSHCFADKCGDGLAAIMWARGVSFREAISLVAEYLDIASPREGRRARPARETSGIVSAASPPPTDLPSNPIDAIAQLKRVSRDALVAFGAIPMGANSISLPAYGPDGASCTNFRIWIEGDEKQQKGKFSRGRPAGLFLAHDDEKRPVLPRPGEVVHLVEGCKDAAALHTLGLMAVGLPNSSMNAKFAELFRGVDVVIVPDLDQPGQSGAQKSAEQLAEIAASIRIARLPGEIRESKGLDVRDILAEDDGEEAVRRAIAEATDWKSSEASGAAEQKKGKSWASWTGTKLTDLGNGERFAEQHGANVRYCHVWKKWLIWDGTRWKIDSMGEVERLAKRTVRSIYLEAAAENIDHDEAEKISRHAHHSERSAAIKSLLSLAQSEEPIPVAVDSLDADAWLLNCENGTIDLTTGQLREHRQEDLLTKRCPIEYPTDAGDEPVLWLNFLDRIFASDNDLIGFVQRLVGMSLVGEVLEHILAILHGGGCNGKSVLLETWGGMLGADYAMKAPHGFLMAKHNESHPTELADLFGKRLVTVAETTDGSRLSEALVKELTGGDTIRARRMREDNWQFKPSHTVVLATNHRPMVRGTDHGLWRRLRLIPFTVTISDAEKDENLTNKLRAELPSILRWAVAGCIDWRRNGLQPPPQVMMATEEYRNTSDTFGAFLDERCLTSTNPAIRAHYKIKASALYSSYKKWCDDNGEYAETQTKFGTRLSERTDLGIFKKKIGSIWWCSITNRDVPTDAEEEQNDIR